MVCISVSLGDALRSGALRAAHVSTTVTEQQGGKRGQHGGLDQRSYLFVGFKGPTTQPPHTNMFAARRLAASAPPPPSSSSSCPLLLRRGLSANAQPKAPPAPADEGAAAWVRRGAALSLLGLTGAVAASAFRDLSVFLSCSSQAMEKATQNQQVVNAIGEPIVRGPWYSASLAVNHARGSVSCTFPVSGPQGDGLLKLKAVRLGDESWFSFLQRSDWEILLMDAILDVPTEDGKHRTIRVTIPDNTTAPPPVDCRVCKSQPAPTPTQTPTPPPPTEK